MADEEIRICLTGGATGGHFFPLVFISREIKRITREQDINFKIFYLGSKPFNEELLKKEGLDIFLLPEVKLRKYFSFQNFIDFFKFPLNLFLAFYYLFKFLPNVIFSKGGPGSLGVILAGWFLRIPIVIHESDSIPGITNKISSFFAKEIFLAFQEAAVYFQAKKVKTLGQPINYHLIKKVATLEDYKRFNLNPQQKVILIFGGSQGSQFLNELTVQILADLLNMAQVVHITGEKHYREVYSYAKGMLKIKKQKKISDYHPYPFIANEDFIYLLKISDLIISRAGSSSIFEIAAVGKPSILIPLDKKIAGEHQLKNAMIYAGYDACFVLEEHNAKPHLILKIIDEIFQNPHLINKMQEGAKKFAKIDAAQNIAKELLKYK